MDENEVPISIYVLPTMPGRPATAVLHRVTIADMEMPELEEGESIVATASLEEAIATWSNDIGTWTVSGQPLPEALSETISEHAASLGVPGFH